jgi:cobalt-zinc-cadmium efflux system protein
MQTFRVFVSSPGDVAVERRRVENVVSRLNLALDAVPAGIDPDAVASYLAGLPWAMSTTETPLTVHMVRPNAGLDDQLLADTAHELDHRFGIRHATLQVEAGIAEGRLAPAHVV